MCYRYNSKIFLVWFQTTAVKRLCEFFGFLVHIIVVFTLYCVHSIAWCLITVHTYNNSVYDNTQEPETSISSLGF